MSRVGKMPIILPDAVDVKVSDHSITVKGNLGTLSLKLNGLVKIVNNSGSLSFETTNSTREAKAMWGTVRALVNNMVIGVTKGFEKKLSLVGVGYKAQAQNSTLNLSLGHSHPVICNMPDDVKCSTPTPTEVRISGIDLQKLGQIAAEIRSFRPPEPYKGKGVRYFDEVVVLKETKKK
jgi:large subunit ribosomal protein L6